MRKNPGRHRCCPCLRYVMENVLILMEMFLGAGLFAYVVIPGMLVMWDRVLDHIGSTGGTPPAK